ARDRRGAWPPEPCGAPSPRAAERSASRDASMRRTVIMTRRGLPLHAPGPIFHPVGGKGVRRRLTYLLTGFVTASCCLVAVAWLSSSERAARERDLRNETQVVAYQFSTRLRSTLEKHIVALQQMANFFEHSDEVTDSEFHA